MNELTVTENQELLFPSMAEGLKKAMAVMEEVKTFEDLERIFLKGAGLSINTYKSYLQSVKLFYEFTNSLNPLQVRAGDIESFYDSLIKKKVHIKTASLRMAGLKRFFAGIRKIIPFYTSPFETMEEKLKQKLSSTGKRSGVKEALTREEVFSLLDFLKSQGNDLSMQNHAIIFMLVTSGLRASELLQLRFEDIEELNGKYKAVFHGKGDKAGESSTQELFEPAVRACEHAYIQTHPKPRPSGREPIFWTIPTRPGEEVRPLEYHALYTRIRKVGKQAIEAGIIKNRSGLEFSPHLFRRSYATGLYNSGMKLKAIQNLTRHASMKTLTDHYIKDEEPATDYLNNWFKEKTA